MHGMSDSLRMGFSTLRLRTVIGALARARSEHIFTRFRSSTSPVKH